MTKNHQLEELEKLKNRLHALERAVTVVIDVLEEEIEKTDAYGLTKRLRKMAAATGMKNALDDARAWINSGKT